MADLKISQLTDGGNSQATDEYVIARSGANYRIDGASIAAAATSVGTLSSLTVSGAITEGGSNVVRQTDIGSAPNEIPLNQYLGTMAYQDAAAINVGSATLSGSATVAGNVGIGVTDPLSKLHQSGSIFLNRATEADFNTGVNQYENFELCRFATPAVFGAGDPRAGNHQFVGTLSLAVTAFRGTTTHHAAHRTTTTSLHFGNFNNNSTSAFVLGALEETSSMFLGSNTSGTLTVALAIEYSTDSGATWSAVSATGNPPPTVTTAALYRVRANLSGTTPTSFTGRFFVTTSFQGFFRVGMTINSLAISII